MSTRLALAALLFAVPSCQTIATDVARQAILDGDASDDDPAVGALLMPNDYPVCSAVLVDARTALTAAHCLWTISGQFTELTAVAFGPDAWQPEHRVAIEWIAPYPLYRRSDFAGDLAVVRLAADVPVAPLAMNRSDVTFDSHGGAVRVVGFGYSEQPPSTQWGTRLTREASLVEVERTRLRHSSVTCYGDSGGPGLMHVGDEERVVSVVSSSLAGCQLYGRSTRIDAFAPWIDDVMASDAASCADDERCVIGCAELDPDCQCGADGLCRECAVGTDPDCGTAEAGAACSSDADCVEGACIDAACVAVCPTGSDLECEEGLTCARGDGIYTCSPPAAGCNVATDPAGGIALVLGLLAAGARRRSQARPRTSLGVHRA